MERVDEHELSSLSRYYFWQRWFSVELSAYTPFREKLFRHRKQFQDEFLNSIAYEFGPHWNGLSDVYDSLRHVSGENELWIATVSSKNVVYETGTTRNIEMVASFMIEGNSPVVVQLGISRSYRYLLVSLEEYSKTSTSEYQFPVHQKNVMDLQSFVANAMISRNDGKQYMTAVLPATMRSSVRTALPGHVEDEPAHSRGYEGKHKQGWLKIELDALATLF